MHADLYRSAVSIAQFPQTPYPEVAFAGRSNVGKSSLLNRLLLAQIARTSQTPGCTRTINFYLVEKSWMWVDLPGVGYAAVSQHQRQGWTQLIRTYLQHRSQLRLTCVLVDSRRVLGPWDMAIIELLENRESPFVVVLTKSDKLPLSALQRQQAQVESYLQQYRYVVEVLPTSARTGLGRDALLAIIRRYCMAPV
ncbi:MAG: ribosome biogenesis GTP-binding protein YihA/YsxC [Candidatus Kapabacteria bacterium]|nr:ribosome biogenesis GTP-binding protein YihA/YsxC [Candidatus Kapabacteria bacterium]MCS7169805.1 ribosome biogenesis GTP-binding protein YihA/YsxC [Candidatus Kapabacteria bacterium]MDW7997360.1 ribosome biogenesis GTP-binding protein YihA/YsxC [Bacteroidota bacterium]MDW8224685.1 ribosome biogenesis GTP-binding protein YihA/YsxC [Bacteroidota bacterium]